MGAFLDKPKTQKTSEESVCNGMPFGVSCMQGWRIEMEDAHRIVFPLPDELSEWAFFSIFDGHAGSNVANQAANRLIHSILDTKQFKILRSDKSQHTNQQLIQEGIQRGFLEFDQILSEEKEERSGSTAVAAFITPQFVILANCGDSRAIIVSDDEVVMSTEDHKPTNPVESKRIEDAGGSVVLQRINGALAVSRSLGDFDYKNHPDRDPVEQLVSAMPEIYFYKRAPQSDKLVFLACDGIWDVLTNTQLAEFVLHRMERVASYAKITEEVLDNCLYKSSRDNMSALLIGLEDRPKVTPELLAEDQRLDQQILDQTNSIWQANSGYQNVSEICDTIEKLDLQHYPPGGLRTKRYLIEDFIQRKARQEDDLENITPIMATKVSYALDPSLNNHTDAKEVV